MATSYVHGQALRLYTKTSALGAADIAEANAFACAKSASLSTSNAVIDVTCLGNTTGTGAGNRQVADGQKSWSMSTEMLYAADVTGNDVVDIEALYAAGTPIFVAFGDGETDKYWTGEGFIASLEVSASTGELATFSITIEGNGALDYGTLS